MADMPPPPEGFVLDSAGAGAAPPPPGFVLDSAPPSPATQPESAPSLGDVGKQFGYGLLSGIPNAISGTADLLEKGTMQGFSNPDTGENLFHQLGRDVGLIKGPAPTPAPYVPKIGGAIKSGLGAVGLNPDNLPAPQSGPERVARMAGEGTILAAAPEAALGDAGLLARAGSMARSGVTGLASGAGSQAATEVVPDQYKPAAAIAGGLLAGVGADAAMSGAANLGRAAGRYAAPFTQAGREAAVGEKLVNSASDPAAVRASLANGADEIVPGSTPTTFQQTGDMGLGSLERSVAGQNPELFMQRRAEQNAARLSALSDIQAQGHPEAMADFVRSHLANIDEQTQNAYNAAQQVSQGQLAGLGGGRTPEAYGAEIQDAINPQMEAATNQARAGLEGLGEVQGAPAIGNQARTALQQQLDASKAAERQLWSAVDPNGALNVLTSPLKRAAQSIYSDMGPAARIGVTPAENDIAGVIGQYGSTIPFSELTDIRSQISQAMRQAKSPLQPNDVAYGRLSQLRSAVENAISDSVEGKAAAEQQAVASGALAPEDTMFANWAKQREDWLAQRGQSAATGTGSVTGLGSNGAGRPAAVSGASGTRGQSGIGSDGAPSAEGFPQNAGSGPLVDQQAADRLTAATAATKTRKAEFGAKPVAGILKRPGETYDYNMPSADVAAQLWKPGPQGAGSINAILKASKNAPDAIEAIRNAAVASLRSKAPDGILTPDILGRWRSQHADALKALETASPGTTARLEQAAQASRALDRFKGYNPQAPVSTLPDRYFGKGEEGFQSVNDLRSLIGKDRADAVLKDYAADSIRKSALGPDGNIDPKKFEAWRKAHTGALRAMPELSASMDSAAAAATHLENVARVRREELSGYEKTAAGKLLNVSDPADVTKTIGGMFGRKDSVKLIRDLATEAKGNPEATAGLRKAVVDFMQSKLVSNTEAATSGQNLIRSDQFQKFLGDNRPALRQLFSDEELGTWQAIARDLKQANRSVTAVKLPGQSNTMQDLAAMAKHGSGPSIMQVIARGLGHFALPGAGYLVQGPTGFAAGLAANYAAGMIGGLRAAGIGKMDELLTEAMLHPNIAKVLIEKAPKRPDVAAQALSRALRASAVAAPALNTAAQR